LQASKTLSIELADSDPSTGPPVALHAEYSRCAPPDAYRRRLLRPYARADGTSTMTAKIEFEV
jgi:hypothetical protein